jgi:hypothetical protein
MKNYSELLATNQTLSVVVNGTVLSAGLHDLLVFKEADTVVIDGIDVLPRYQYLAENNTLTIPKPFYQWYHDVAGQGWLLNPNK